MIIEFSPMNYLTKKDYKGLVRECGRGAGGFINLSHVQYLSLFEFQSIWTVEAIFNGMYSIRSRFIELCSNPRIQST